MDWLAESNGLHARVRRFAASADGDFEALALAIADFQRRQSPGHARLVQRRGAALDRLEHIPAVPSAAFRLTRVAVHPPEFDRVRFVTSGTTAQERGCHFFRTLDTYRELALTYGRAALLPAAAPRAVVVCLAPQPTTPPTSSLGFMMQLFLEHFDGVAPSSAIFAERWLVHDDALSLDGLERAALHAEATGAPLLILATSFALVALLDALVKRPLRFPATTRVMETGGFKGKVHDVQPEALRARVTAALGIPAQHIIGEYGMTELTSQLYTAADGAALAASSNVYREPPWLRVVPVDPSTLLPVAEGDVGIARIVDLGNVDSAVAVQTEDRVRRVDTGVELLGRAAGAPARGCSLSVEALLEAQTGAAPVAAHAQ